MASPAVVVDKHDLCASRRARTALAVCLEALLNLVCRPWPENVDPALEVGRKNYSVSAGHERRDQAGLPQRRRVRCGRLAGLEEGKVPPLCP